MKNYNGKIKKITNWIKVNKIEFYSLLLVLFIALFLRLWRIDEYLPFLGDEGRDVRVVRRFIADFDLMFIGPRTSIGDMYLGPAYYYLIAPFLLLFNFSPTGPAVFVSLLSVATVFLIWHVAREWFGKIAAFSAALLYAISPTIIGFAQHSWNPNIMPFFALLSIYALWKICLTARIMWFVVLGIAMGFVAQSHYLGFLLFPVIACVALINLLRLPSVKKRKFLIGCLLSFGVFLLTIVPLFLFDYKHGWQNFEALKKFLTERQTTVSAKPWNAIPALWPLWKDNLITRILAAKDINWGLPYSIFLLFIFYLWKSAIHRRAYSILFIWLIVGLLGLGLLKQNIYDHYFGFLFPVPFLIIGAIAQGIWERGKKVLIIVLVAPLVIHSIINLPLKNPPQRQMQSVQEVNRQIIEDSKGEPFNFGLIAERNYEEGYLYFFEQERANVREINPVNTKDTLTEQLYVVCEDPVCEPINHRKAEIANFGWAKIEKQWEVGGHKIFKLVHTQ